MLAQKQTEPTTASNGNKTKTEEFNTDTHNGKVFTLAATADRQTECTPSVRCSLYICFCVSSVPPSSTTTRHVKLKHRKRFTENEILPQIAAMHTEREIDPNHRQWHARVNVYNSMDFLICFIFPVPREQPCDNSI